MADSVAFAVPLLLGTGRLRSHCFLPPGLKGNMKAASGSLAFPREGTEGGWPSFPSFLTQCIILEHIFSFLPSSSHFARVFIFTCVSL